VKKVDDKSLEAFLAEANETAKAILFTEKGTTSALIKSVAIEFKGSISVAQIRNTQKASVELFGITEFPTLLLLPGGKEAEGIVFDGELKKDAIVAFLSQAATPNPDPAPAKVKLPKSKDSKKASKAKEQFESVSKSQTSEEGTAAAASATEETLETEVTESPSPEVEHEKPVVVELEPAPPIGLLPTEDILRAECLGPKTGTCILALLPQNPPETAALAVSALSEIAHKAKLHRHHLFPFYVVPDINPGYALLTEKLDLGGETEIIAVNGRRGWWRKLPTLGDKVIDEDVTEDALRDWVESIKLGDIAKSKLPPGLIIEEPEEPVIEEPIVEEPTVQKETVIDETIIEEAATQEPLEAQEPIVEEILIEQSEVEEEIPVTETIQGEATTVTAVVEEVKVEETVAAEPEPEKEKPHDEL
jgi:protein disulfide-isomerase A6